MLFSASIAKPDRKAESTGRNTRMFLPAYTLGGVLTTIGVGGGGVGGDGRSGGGDGCFSHPVLTSKMIIGIRSSFFIIKILGKQLLHPVGFSSVPFY